MTLEAIWEVLENGAWTSKRNLQESTGIDEDTLHRAINFLDRWNFIEIQRSPELLLRRKPGIISPLQTFDLLRAVTTSDLADSNRRRLAQRVACRVCGGHDLAPIDKNEVECTQCHEKQWYSLEIENELLVEAQR